MDDGNNSFNGITGGKSTSVEPIFAFLGVLGTPLAIILSRALNVSAKKSLFISDSDLEDILSEIDVECIGKESHYGQTYLYMFANIFVGKFMGDDAFPSLFIKCRCDGCGAVSTYLDSLKYNENSSDIKLHDTCYLNESHNHSCNSCSSLVTSTVSSSILYSGKNSEVLRIYVRVKDSSRLRDKVERRILYDLAKRLSASELKQHMPSKEGDGLLKIVNKEKVLIGDVNGIRLIAKDIDACYRIKAFVDSSTLWSVTQIDDYFHKQRNLDKIKSKRNRPQIIKSQDNYEFINIYVEYAGFPYNIQIMTDSAEEKDRNSKERNHQTFSEIQTANKNYVRKIVEKIYGADVIQTINYFLDKVIKKP